MVRFSVHLYERCPKALADLAEDLFHAREVLAGEDASPVLGDEDQVCMDT
jgi:hypothetical protein